MVDHLDRVGLPTRIGDLLLTLAGRLDDNALIEARELLAVAELGRAVELTLGCLAAGPIPVTDAEHDELSRLADRLLLDERLLSRLEVCDQLSVQHRFTAGSRGDPAPEEGVLDALNHVLGVLPDIRGLWCVWRTTPAGAVPGPVPQRIVLVEVGPAGFAPATAYRASCALRVAGIRGVVEVLRSSGGVPQYHDEALAAARSVPLGNSLADSAAKPSRPSRAAVGGFGAARSSNSSNRSGSSATSGSSDSDSRGSSPHDRETQPTGSSDESSTIGAPSKEPESRSWTPAAEPVSPETATAGPATAEAPSRPSVFDEPGSTTNRPNESALVTASFPEQPTVAAASTSPDVALPSSPAALSDSTMSTDDSAMSTEPTSSMRPPAAQPPSSRSSDSSAASDWWGQHPEKEQQADAGSAAETPAAIGKDHALTPDNPTTSRSKSSTQIPGSAGLNHRELGLLRQLHEELSRREKADRELSSGDSSGGGSKGNGPGDATFGGSARPPARPAEQGFSGWMSSTEPQRPKFTNVNGSQPYPGSA